MIGYAYGYVILIFWITGCACVGVFGKPSALSFEIAALDRDAYVADYLFKNQHTWAILRRESMLLLVRLCLVILERVSAIT
jgi:hypothetical protein